MTKKTKIVTGLVAATIITAAIAVAIKTRDKSPDFTGKSPEEIRDYLESDEFKNLDQENRQQITQKVFEPMRNEIIIRMQETAKTYSQLPAEQKIAFLDKQIDQMQERIRAFQKRMSDGELPRQLSGPFGQGSGNTNTDGVTKRGPTPEIIRNRMEQIDPEARAYMTEFFEDIQKRMDQKEIEMPFGRPGGGRGR